MKLKKERIELAKETLDRLRSITGVQQAKKDDEAEFQVPARTGRRERRGEVWSTAQTRIDAAQVSVQQACCMDMEVENWSKGRVACG